MFTDSVVDLFYGYLINLKIVVKARRFEGSLSFLMTIIKVFILSMHALFFSAA